MSDINYDEKIGTALLGVVKSTLEDVAKDGLPGEHHFYIVFNPKISGVTLSERNRKQYGSEMTIVLQHQFFDLKVTDVGFSVRLSFNSIPETLFVPFKSILVFADPSVGFEIKFNVKEEPIVEIKEEIKPEIKGDPENKVVSFANFKRK